MYEAIIPLYYVQWKLRLPDGLDTCSIQLDWIHSHFFTEQIFPEIPGISTLQAGGRSSQINWRLLSKHIRAITISMLMASNILLPDKCPPISCTTTNLVQAPPSFSWTNSRHSYVFPASALSLPSSPLSTIIWWIQSIHPKIENSSWLSLPQTPSVLYIGLMIKDPKSWLEGLALALLTWPSFLQHHPPCHLHPLQPRWSTFTLLNV